MPDEVPPFFFPLLFLSSLSPFPELTVHLSRNWADELGTHPSTYGTTFNSISVGFTKTEAYTRIPSYVRESLTAADAAEVAVGNRIGEVQDVADVAGLLVGEKARWISGSVVDASGGKAKIM